MDFATADLDDASDRDRLITSEIQDSLQNEIGVQTRGAKRRGVACLEREGEQDACIESPMMIGVARKDEAIHDSLAFIRVQIGHARQIRRFEGELLKGMIERIPQKA